MSSESWRTLRAGRPDELVLTVDYWPGRTGAGFRELAAELGGTSTVLESVPPPAGDRLGGARRYLERWCAGIDPAAVRLVLGNCVGAAFAVALAGRLAELGGRETPPVAVFDPQVLDVDMLTGEFDRMIVGFDAVPGTTVPAAPGDLVSYADELAARYGLLVAGLGATDDAFDEDYLDELTAQGRRYLSYLAAAAELDLTGVPPAVVAFASTELCSGFGLAARAVRFDTARASLLAHYEVVLAVNDMMGVTT